MLKAEDVTKRLGEIRDHMPEVYRSISTKAKTDGNAVFGLVRRGIRGEPDCFYAFEGGRVVGTPFAMPGGLQADVALLMVQFGATFCSMFGPMQEEGRDGTH